MEGSWISSVGCCLTAEFGDDYRRSEIEKVEEEVVGVNDLDVV